jgi:LuxR family maltose regulon positive regulatory protein
MQWVDSVSSMAAPMELFIWLEVPQITRARVLIADSSKKNLKKAWESLTQLRQTSERCHYTCQIIEISVLQSLALERMGKTEQALDILEEVVALAGPLGWIRPFIEAGPPMADLLVQLQARGVTDDYLEMLLIEQKRTKYEKISTTLEHHSKDTATLSPVIKIPEPELLSRRELEIVRLLAQGLRNKEIATRLYLSLSTIKSHLYNIYQKWNVHSRTSLLAKARKFGMINE